MEVHLWYVRLEGSAECEGAFFQTLSPDEKVRARGFHFERLRKTYTLARGVLRALAGSYLDTPAAGIEFRYGPNGKPSLARADCRLRFNLSRSGDLAIYAFARDCELGVDVEELRPMPGLERIAAEFFCPEECADLAVVDESSRERAFFNCWTRKEAYIKALGDGLSLPLDSFRVSLHPEQPAALLEVRGQPDEAGRWSMRHLIPAAGYAGALSLRDCEPIVQARPCLTAEQVLASDLPGSWPA
ncbi:MAG: 4'-phosphopantetheinyl transferase superfamily protein [Acidobacteria bacterium]|nr:4'-phosphopantetheinyl transferase superfamily protein [Acidobacteriota bacterium]